MIILITLEVRGEIYMKLEPFRKLNQQRREEGEATYANPRNLTAGSLRQLDARLTSPPTDYQLLRCSPPTAFGEIDTRNLPLRN